MKTIDFFHSMQRNNALEWVWHQSQGSKCPAEKGLAKLNDVDLKREENVSLGPTDILKIALGIH